MAGVARLQRAERLRDARDFKRVGLSGTRLASRFFVVLAEDRGDSGEAKLGITASRRVGGAVQRNRVKRLIREWFRTHKPRAGLDLVVIARSPAVVLSQAQASAELDRLIAEVAR